MIALQMKPGKPFTVLNLTDVQVCRDDINPDANTDCGNLYRRTVAELVERTKPDLITLSGDLSYGDAPDFEITYGAIGAYIESFGIDWALVFGNHDNQGGAEHISRIVEIYRTFAHFRFESGDSALGNGNYVIKAMDGERTVAGIIMMDTHDRAPYTDKNGTTSNVWAKLIPEQLVWYKEQIKALGGVNTVLITHIPIFAYQPAFREAFAEGINPQSVSPEESYNGSCWNEGYKDSFGVRYEGECCYPEDEGALDAIIEAGSTSLVVCGHDHVNNWCVRYKGIRLMYALKTGMGCYWNRVLNGGTVIKLNRDGTIDAEHIHVEA